MVTAQVLQPSGVLDAALGARLRDQVVEALAASPTAVLIDMAGITFMDSSGFGALVMVLKRSREAGCRLALGRPNSQVRLVLELTGTDRVFELVDDPEGFS